MNTRLALAASLIAAPFAVADDWPHWMGPKRDNVWYETGIVEKFPQGGPKKVWTFPVAGGYSGPAVAAGKVFVTDYQKQTGDTDEGNFQRKETSGKEGVYCLDAKTGKKVWEHHYDVKYAISYPVGPRCTPTVDGDRVYTLGAEGKLICFQAADGKVLWEKDLKAEYKTKSPLWGYSAHPLIDGDKLITLAGGEGSHVVAFDKKTGKEIWKAETDSDPNGFGYVPPSIITAGGKRQLILVGPGSLKGLDPDTGKRYWKQDYKADSGSVIMTPIVSGDYLYFGGYRSKNILLKLATDKPDATTEWRDKKGMGVHAVNVQPFLHDGLIYGFDESGKLFAVELPSGKRVWESTDVIGYAKGSDTAFIIKNGDRFFFFTETGDLVIGKLDKAGFTELDRAKGLIELTQTAFGRKVVWCQPAFADKKMFVRNDKELVCFDLAK
ncbi:MAG: PQQ-like beta-propeller repeat protein [Fimbriiglobus sp.]|nr:PQQ-like beta-propeller repeat protein [Fimbriiglobus sp.]